MFWGCFPQECRLPQVTSDMTTWSDWVTPTKRQDVPKNTPPFYRVFFLMIDTVLKKGLFMCVPPKEYDCWWWSSETERGGIKPNSLHERIHTELNCTLRHFFSILKRSGVGFFGQIAQLPSRKHKHGFSKSGALVTRNIFWSSTVSSWERQGFWVLAILDDSGVNINPSPALWSVARCCSDGEKAWGCGEHDELKLLMEIGRYDLLLRYFQMSETPPN